MNILETITERTRERIAEEKKKIPLTEIRRQAEERLLQEQKEFSKKNGEPGETQNRMPAFEQALRADGLSFICEAKKASPSKG